MSQSTAEHKAKAPLHLRFALITISTSRYSAVKVGKPVENPSGDIIVALLREAEHSVIYNAIIPDDENQIRRTLKRVVQMPTVDTIITAGGTGITRTDVTIETVTSLFVKTLPGFGEMFRRLSFETIGSAAVLTRATAGVIEGKAVFCLPGSPQAAIMALTHIIIPEAGHIVTHARE
ncbi:MAG: MogA/MoaB family molybdenum cofactor biosynthesis protein [Candidatus Hermodarchaeia archaeon]|jgi:molybdenum cofactor biosynthesis protein B